MFTKFQAKIKEIMENTVASAMGDAGALNISGSGGVYGKPQQAIYDPANGKIDSGDRYAEKDERNVTGATFPDSKKKEKIKKGVKNFHKPLVIRRELQIYP